MGYASALSFKTLSMPDCLLRMLLEPGDV
jgi:hypothetical protein